MEAAGQITFPRGGSKDVFYSAILPSGLINDQVPLQHRVIDRVSSRHRLELVPIKTRAVISSPSRFKHRSVVFRTGSFRPKIYSKDVRGGGRGMNNPRGVPRAGIASH